MDDSLYSVLTRVVHQVRFVHQRDFLVPISKNARAGTVTEILPFEAVISFL